jgi:hypothetical protein
MNPFNFQGFILRLMLSRSLVFDKIRVVTGTFAR